MTTDALCAQFSVYRGGKNTFSYCQCNNVRTYGVRCRAQDKVNIKPTENLSNVWLSFSVETAQKRNRHKREIRLICPIFQFTAEAVRQWIMHPVIIGGAFGISSPPVALFDSAHLRSPSYHPSAVSSTGLYSCRTALILLLSAAAQSAVRT